MEWKIRPTALILGTDDRKRLSKWDLVLIEAHQILQRERCPQCGYPRWVCSNEDPDIEVQFRKDTCFVTQAQDRFEKREEKARNSGSRKKERAEAPAGETAHPIAYRISGKPLEDLREPYYESENKRYEAMIASRPKPRPSS